MAKREQISAAAAAIIEANDEARNTEQAEAFMNLEASTEPCISNTAALKGAFQTIADFFRMTEVRTARSGEQYEFNHLFFSQKNTMQSLIWSTERRLADCYSLEIRGEYGTKKLNKYGLPYAVRVLEAAMTANKGGELDLEAIVAATENLERVQEEIAHVDAFYTAIIEFFDGMYGTTTMRRNFEAAVAPKDEQQGEVKHALDGAAAALAKLGRKAG